MSLPSLTNVLSNDGSSLLVLAILSMSLTKTFHSLAISDGGFSFFRSTMAFFARLHSVWRSLSPTSSSTFLAAVQNELLLPVAAELELFELLELSLPPVRVF